MVVNITCNVNYPTGTINAVSFTGGNSLAYFGTTIFPSVIYGSYGNGKYVFVGYEFSSMYIYQQDYVMNKIIMWLSNINIRYGNDLALSDLKITPSNPYFMQNVTISFVIINYSPKPLTDVSLEVLIDNMPINGQPIYTINYINGNWTYLIYNITWQATTPGPHTIYGYVNPFHTIPEVNYNNNALNSLVNTTILVRYSTLVIWVHDNTGNQNNITYLTNTLKNLGINYKFLEYIEGSSQSINSPNLNDSTSIYYLLKYNLVIVDFNQTGDLSSSPWGKKLANAIYNYINNKNTTKYPYSLLITGENAGKAINSNTTIMKILKINTINTINVKQISGSSIMGYLYGLVYNGVNTNTGPLGQNLSRGYGLYYKYYNYLTVIKLNPTVNGTAIFDVYNYTPSSKPNYTGNAVIENISNVIVTIFPYSIENIIGFIQNHTISYSPRSTSSNPLFSTIPSSAQYARNFLMMNFLVASRYMFNNPLPEITSPDISINSPVVTLNNYYLFTVTIRNLGTVPIYITLKAFEETSMFYSSQPIYLVGSTMNSITTVTTTIIWKPTYASSPNPEWLRFVLVPSSGQIPLSPMQEALITQKVYFFYDNFTNGGVNWNHYDEVFGVTGIQRYGPGLSNYYSNEPYSVFGSLSNLFSAPGNYPAVGTPYQYGNHYPIWYLYPNGTSGGYSIGVSHAVNNWSIKNNIISNSGMYCLETNYISIANGKSIIIEFYASYQLSLGGEGVILFVAHDNGNNWHWVPPLQGYPGNINTGFLSNSFDGKSFLYPQGGGLVPAFTGISGGWKFYQFNLSNAYAQGNNPVTTWQNIKILLVFGFNSGYYGNLYGDDNFYIDDFKVKEIGNITPNSNAVNSGTIGDTWQLQTINYNGSTYTGFYNSLSYKTNSGSYSFNYDEIDNLISVPISLTNAINANMNFLTQYVIYARYGDATIPSDVPTGFRFYIGIVAYNGIMWYQMDTRWAGEAGYSVGSYSNNYKAYLMNASQIVSAYYSSTSQNGQTIIYQGAFQNSIYPVINITGFVGQTIVLRFEVNGDNSQYYQDSSTANTPEFSYGANEPSPPYYVFITNVVIQGYSLYSPIQVQSVWT